MRSRSRDLCHRPEDRRLRARCFPARTRSPVLGHEALARSGDLVEPRNLVVLVRRPCSRSRCVACTSGRPDFCFAGDYAERGQGGQRLFFPNRGRSVRDASPAETSGRRRLSGRCCTRWQGRCQEYSSNVTYRVRQKGRFRGAAVAVVAAAAAATPRAESHGCFPPTSGPATVGRVHRFRTR